jgi:hypothetical protein
MSGPRSCFVLLRITHALGKAVANTGQHESKASTSAPRFQIDAFRDIVGGSFPIRARAVILVNVSGPCVIGH